MQGLAGIKDVKINGSHPYIVSKISTIAYKYGRVSGRFATAIQIPRLLLETLAIVGFIVILYSMLFWGKSSAEIIAILGLFGMAGLRLIPNLNRILSSASNLRRYSSDIQSVYEAYEYDDTVIIKNKPRKSNKKVRLENVIKLENVTYSYPGAESFGLKNISLNINKNDFIGFAGHSGSGKSTLLDIIIGLLTPNIGSVEVDGKNIKEFLTDWQRNIGMVPQNLFIADDTLLNNVAFGIQKENVNYKRVEEVLSLAGMDRVVKGLPEGLETLLGEHMTGLSGGEMQRICIARALYNDPEILVLDEATSSLDLQTKEGIMGTVRDLSKNRTIIMATHDIEVLNYCDRFLTLDTGKIKLGHGQDRP